MRKIPLRLAALGCAALLTAPAGQAVANGVEAGPARVPVAEDRLLGPLPDVGQEFIVPIHLSAVAVKIGDKVLTFDAEGTWKPKVEANPDSPADSVLLDNTVIRLEGESVGSREKLTIRIERHGDHRSLLKLTQPVPPKYENTMVFGLTVTIKAADGRSNPYPLVLRTKDPVELRSPELAEFPPRGDLYRLRNPIELVNPDGDQVVATIDKFPVTVG
ncbi:hypothetical protein SUDANB95_00077 [Actinosynnema sp. ALI-1.44]